MFVPKSRQPHASGDTSQVVLANGGGFIDFVQEFKYLGSLVHHSLSSDADVNMRIKSASAAFGALRKSVLSNRDAELKVKGKIYVALVVNILLYGSESWCLREDLFNRLRSFHNCCARSMCRVTLAHSFRHHIPTSDLLSRLGIRPIDDYYHNRILRWAGHVARMSRVRLPRKLLTGWVAHPRPVGCPQMTWGRTLNKALKSKGVSCDFATWRELAQDRGDWAALTRPPQGPYLSSTSASIS